MGRKDKALLKINEEQIISRQLKVLSKIFDRTIIIGKDFSIKNTDFYKDSFDNCGPIAGIHSAITNAKSDYVFVIPCDLPFLSGSLITGMINTLKASATDALIPKHGDKIEPLHSFYHKSVLKTIEKMLNEENYKTRNLFSRLNIKYFDVNLHYNPDLSFFNINTPEDLLKANKYAKREFK